MTTNKSSELQMSVMMTPQMTDTGGTVESSELLKILGQVACSCASRYSGRSCIPLSVDKVTFEQPLYEGELALFFASVNHTSPTSMEIGIRVEAKNTHEGTSRHTNSAYFTMIAIDRGKLAAIPQLTITTELQRSRSEAAEQRKKIRLQESANYRSNENE